MTASGRILVTPRSLTTAGLTQVAALDPLRERGYELIGSPPGRLPTDQELLELLPGCVGWLAGVEPIDEHVLAAATTLRVISRNGAGTDAIDLDAARRAGIRVERAAGANAQGVAELILVLVLCALRQIVPSAAAVRTGAWDRRLGAEIADREVGVIGIGEVGQRTAAAFAALGAGVRGFDPFPVRSPVPLVDLATLLATSDVISLSCPPPADGRPIIDVDRLRTVPVGTVLVNTARATLVDDDAVLAALDAGRLAYYAVDVFDREPPTPSPLLHHPQVIATPHIGAYTSSSVRRATILAVDNLLSALENR